MHCCIKLIAHLCLRSRAHVLIYRKVHCLCNRGGTVHVFVPNRHGTGIAVRCMMPYDEYRQFTPNPEGAPAAMQRCLITAAEEQRMPTVTQRRVR